MAKLTVGRFMTPSPHVVTSGKTLAQAHQAMREKGIRHLPVVEGGRLVGLVSQRDLYLLETLKGVDVARETIEEAMTADPIAIPLVSAFVVLPTASRSARIWRARR